MRRTLVALWTALLMPVWIHAQCTCAWVLWKQTSLHANTPPYEQVSWDIVTSAFESAKACQTMKQASVDKEATFHLQEKAPNVESVKTVGDELVIVALKKGGFHELKYICLPNTIDPRPR